MTDPYQQLVSLLESRMVKHSQKAVNDINPELGTITSSGLKLDSFKHEIQDYLIADWLVKAELPSFNIQGNQSGFTDSFGGAVSGEAYFSMQASTIEDIHLELKHSLKPGDRVLALPVNGGQDIVVICKVVS